MFKRLGIIIRSTGGSTQSFSGGHRSNNYRDVLVHCSSCGHRVVDATFLTRNIECFLANNCLLTLLSHCWLGSKKGIWPVKKWGDGAGGHWLVWMEWRPAGWSVSASVNLPLYHKVQKFSSGTGLPGWSRKKGHKMVVVVVVLILPSVLNHIIGLQYVT